MPLNPAELVILSSAPLKSHCFLTVVLKQPLFRPKNYFVDAVIVIHIAKSVLQLYS